MTRSSEQPLFSPGHERRPPGSSGLLLNLATVLSLTAALAHFSVMRQHFEQWWGYGTFFLIAAIAQQVYPWVLLRWPTRLCLGLGMAGNVGIIGLYALTRTTGIPIVGPDAGRVEGVGAVDLVATGAEVTLVGVLGVLLWDGARVAQQRGDKVHVRGASAGFGFRRPVTPSGILAVSAPLAVLAVAFSPSLAHESHSDAARLTPQAHIPRCSGAAALACYERRYRALAGNYGAQLALAELLRESRTNGFVELNCHQFAHIIGRAARAHAAHVGRNGGQPRTFCGAGYAHARMEVRVAQAGFGNAVNEADGFCREARRSRPHSVEHHNCAHGLGHGFMRAQERGLLPSLKACDALRDGWERQQCYSGAFMENLMSPHPPRRSSRLIRASRPLHLCNLLAPRYRRQCYPYQAQHALRTSGNDYGAVFELCARVEGGFRGTCYRGLGAAAASDSIAAASGEVDAFDHTSVRCALGPRQEARRACITGAVREMMLRHYSGQAANAFCDALDADLRSECKRVRARFSNAF